MSRVLWKGSISFGLVHVPVGVYPGEERKDLSFDLLDRRDLSPVGYRKINKNTGEEVPREEIVKAYRLEDGTYVIVSDEDFERASPRRARTIEIVSFVSAAEIRPVFYESPYLLEPLEDGDKGYALLREALAATGKVGVAKVVLRTRGRLAAVFPDGDALVLNLLRYAHELRDPGRLRLPGRDLSRLGVSDKEVKMAGRLIEDMVEPWKPEQLRDEYRDELLSFIRAKAEKGEAAAARAVPEPGRAAAPVTDLMSLLKRSVARAEQARPRRGKAG